MDYLAKIKVRIEPSKRLSEILGFPYFIEKSFTVQEMLDKHIITVNDLRKMESGQEIMKQIPVVGDRDGLPSKD